MSEKEFKEIERLMLNILKCKTQAHRNLAVSMIISLLKEKIKSPTPEGEKEGE